MYQLVALTGKDGTTYSVDPAFVFSIEPRERVESTPDRVVVVMVAGAATGATANAFSLGERIVERVFVFPTQSFDEANQLANEFANIVNDARRQITV